MAEYLVELGHTRIGYIAGPKGMRSTRERLEGFCDALEKHGRKPCEEMLARGAYTFESGMECARTLLAHPYRPTAIFASNDEMAIGVIIAAQNLGLKVPDDLSVSGFDDCILASRLTPTLTTIRRPVKEMARLATTKLIASIDGRYSDASRGITLVPSLIVRNSRTLHLVTRMRIVCNINYCHRWHLALFYTSCLTYRNFFSHNALGYLYE